jgi:hypothetical protein
MALKKLSSFSTVVLSLTLLVFAGILILQFAGPLVEEYFFGTQGGTMVQLQTSHVPTMGDLDAMEEERKQVQRDLIDMTGSY